MTEMDTDFMLKTLDHIKVFEDGTLRVVFLDGTEIECKMKRSKKRCRLGVAIPDWLFSCISSTLLFSFVNMVMMRGCGKM